MHFAEYMKNLRKEKSLTQQQMAEILDVSVQSIKMIENGHTKFPSKKVMERLCEYLDLFPVEIAEKILFWDDIFEEDEQGFAASRYIAYKYLHGWNIDKVPIVLDYGQGTLTCPGKISKRRDPKNTSIVMEFGIFQPGPKAPTFEDAFDIISTIIMIAIRSKEPFRKIEIVFDIGEYYENASFQLLENTKIYKLPIDVDLILFLAETGELCDTIHLRKDKEI